MSVRPDGGPFRNARSSDLQDDRLTSAAGPAVRGALTDQAILAQSPVSMPSSPPKDALSTIEHDLASGRRRPRGGPGGADQPGTCARTRAVQNVTRADATPGRAASGTPARRSAGTTRPDRWRRNSAAGRVTTGAS